MDDFMSDVRALQDQAQQMQYDRRALKQVARCLSQLRGTSAIMNLQAAHIFVEVALQQGITVSELIKRTGLSQASCSRNMALLSERHRKGSPGLELVVSIVDPHEKRRRIVFLTPLGAELAAGLTNVVKYP